MASIFFKNDSSGVIVNIERSFMIIAALLKKFYHRKAEKHSICLFKKKQIEDGPIMTK